MEIRARGGCKPEISGQRGEPIEIRGPDACDRNLDGLTTGFAKLSKQTSQCATREPISMRMGEYHSSAGRSQGRHGVGQGGPFFGDVSGSASRQPQVEGLRDVTSVPRDDERAGEVHTCRHVRFAQNGLDQGSRGDPRLALESLADLREPRAAPRPDARQVCPECLMRGVEVETDHMQRLSVPAAGHFDTCHMLQAMSVAGEASGLAARDGIVVGERGQRDAPGCTKFDERIGRQQAIRVMAVQMQIGEGSRAHRRYESPMTLLPEHAPRWDDIDTVLLDLDGTLLDLAFDNYIWLARVAEIYAENNGLSLAETHAELAPRFKRVQGTLDWYSIDYWSAQLRIDIERVHREEAHRVAWLPGARGFLEQVRERGKRLVLMTNSHPKILAIKDERTRVLGYLDAAYTSHGFGAPKEDQRFWIAARSAEPFDLARTMFVDDSKAVLHAAIEAGVRWVYGVKRPDTSREPYNHEEFAAIDGVLDLL